MKQFLFCIAVLFSAISYAQNVGIGTNIPGAKLEITASNIASPTNQDGMLVPRISNFPAINPGANQNSMLVFLTTVSGANEPGFYYWDNATTSWKAVGENRYWGINGNGNTSGAVNFIGTINNTALVFKQNNTQAGLLAPSNTSWGVAALNPLTSGNGNTALGVNTMRINTTGYNNTGVGTASLFNNTAGYRNTAVGTASLLNNDDGFENTAIGHESLSGNGSGNGNVAVGYQPLFQNSSGAENVAIGYQPLYNNAAGANNIGLGYKAMYNNTQGDYNIAIGQFALSANQTADSNIAIGGQSMLNNTSGTYNTAVGQKALFFNFSGSQNTAVGLDAGYKANNSFGTYLGYQAGRNTNGVSNTYIGWGAGTDASVATTQPGGDNVCVGVRAGQAITTGTQNIAIGNVANISNGTFSNTITIGHTATNTQSNSVVLGNGAITKWGFGVNAAAANVLEFNAAVTTARLTIGGVWTNASDKNIKANFTALDKKEVLNSIMQLPITRWNYLKETSNNTHIGPMAQDFYRLFNTGNDDKTISTIDPAGVALIGVQQLKNEIDELKKEISELKKLIKISNK